MLEIVLLLGISYALFQITLNGKKINKITTGKFSLMITDLEGNPEYTIDDTYKNDLTEAINIENAVPMSDTEGKEQEIKYDFKLVNNGTVNASYELSLEDLEIEVDEERIDSSLIRYSLIKDGTEKVEGLADGSINVIDSGLIGKEQEKVYTLRIWIKESATREEAEEKVYSAHLKLDGTQYNGEINEYGTEIASWNVGDEDSNVAMTYYQSTVEQTNNSSNNAKVKPMSNIEKLDNTLQYEGGTIVIDGEGEVKPYLAQYLLDADRIISACEEAVEDDDTIYYNVETDEWYSLEYIKSLNLTNQEILRNYQICFDFIEDGDIEEIFNKYGIVKPSKIVYKGQVKNTGVGAWTGLSFIEKVDLGNVEIIDKDSFNCIGIRKLNVPSSVNLIGEEAFWYCNELTEIYINAKEIGKDAFQRCKKLAKITLGSSVEKIDDYAFCDDIYIPVEMYISSVLNI